jgi:hypothetical protein
MVSRDDFFQLTQAKTTHSALQAMASKRGTYPTGREAINTAGQKIKAMISKPTEVVYRVPVDFWLESNIATSSVDRGDLRELGSDRLT